MCFTIVLIGYVQLNKLFLGLESLTTDPRVRGSSPWHDKIFPRSEESRQLSVIPGVGITRYGQIDRKDQDIAR